MTLNREFYDRIDLDSLVNLIDLYRPEFTPFGNEAAATPSPHAAQDVASLVSGRPHRGGRQLNHIPSTFFLFWFRLLFGGLPLIPGILLFIIMIILICYLDRFQCIFAPSRALSPVTIGRSHSRQVSTLPVGAIEPPINMSSGVRTNGPCHCLLDNNESIHRRGSIRLSISYGRKKRVALVVSHHIFSCILFLVY